MPSNKESRRQAFYTIWIEPMRGGFRVCKESGGMGKIWHRQAWEFPTLEQAEKLFERRIREKTNAEGKRMRKYCLCP